MVSIANIEHNIMQDFGTLNLAQMRLHDDYLLLLKEKYGVIPGCKVALNGHTYTVVDVVVPLVYTDRKPVVRVEAPHGEMHLYDWETCPPLLCS